jgi:hypothetical protein
MKFNEAFKGNFMKAADLGGKARRYTIKSIGPEEVGGEDKIVMRFDGEDRALVLNKTNAVTLRDVLGEELDDWAGNPVVLKPDKTDFQGKRVDCIRLAVPQKKAPAPVVETEPDEETDDVNF